VNHPPPARPVQTRTLFLGAPNNEWFQTPLAHLLSPCIVRDTTRRPGGDAEAPPTDQTRGVLLRFCQEHPPTCAPHRLLGPCYKTGRGRPCHAKPGCPLHRTPSGERPAHEDHHQCGAVVGHQSLHHTRHPGPARPKTHRTRHMQPRVNKSRRARQGNPGSRANMAGEAHTHKVHPDPPFVFHARRPLVVCPLLAITPSGPSRRCATACRHDSS